MGKRKAKIETELKGRNQIEKFRHIAEELVSRISSYKAVAGIVFIGGLVRGFVDKFSDLDIIVFLDRKDEQLRRQFCNLRLATQRRYCIDVDLEVHFLEDFKKRKWEEIDKWEFSRARIVFDPNREIKKVFSEKLGVPKDFWIRRIVVCAEYLKWYCCPPKEDVGTVAESWIERGDLMVAHYCLSYAVELLISLVFALNKEFLPAPKWRIFYSYSLKWLPKDYKQHVKEAMNARISSTRDFKRRLEAIREIWRDIQPKIEKKTGLTTEQRTKYYVEKILHLDSSVPSHN